MKSPEESFVIERGSDVLDKTVQFTEHVDAIFLNIEDRKYIFNALSYFSNIHRNQNFNGPSVPYAEHLLTVAISAMNINKKISKESVIAAPIKLADFYNNVNQDESFEKWKNIKSSNQKKIFGNRLLHWMNKYEKPAKFLVNFYSDKYLENKDIINDIEKNYKNYSMYKQEINEYLQKYNFLKFNFIII